MLLRNPTDQPILFKIKTTAPKRYCVRPNSGLLEPHNSLEVGSKWFITVDWWWFHRPWAHFHDTMQLSFQFVYNHSSSIPMKSTDTSLWFKVLSHQMATTVLKRWYVELGRIASANLSWNEANHAFVVFLQWREVKPEQLMDSKLRCVFDIPEDKKAPSTPGTKNAAGTH